MRNLAVSLCLVFPQVPTGSFLCTLIGDVGNRAALKTTSALIAERVFSACLGRGLVCPGPYTWCRFLVVIADTLIVCGETNRRFLHDKEA